MLIEYFIININQLSIFQSFPEGFGIFVGERGVMLSGKFSFFFS